MAFSVRADIRAVTRDLTRVQRSIVPAATVSALNKTAAHIRTHASRKIASAVGVPVRLIRGQKGKHPARVAIQRATRSRPSAFVYAKLLGIRASRLGTPRQTKAGARVGGRKFDGAFVATALSGHEVVFFRKPAARNAGGRDIKGRLRRQRLPIAEHVIPINPPAEQIIDREVFTIGPGRFKALFEHEIRFRLERKGL